MPISRQSGDTQLITVIKTLPLDEVSKQNLVGLLKLQFFSDELKNAIKDDSA